MDKLADVQTLIGQLYESFYVREHYANMEKQVLVELEAVKLELEPLELVSCSRNENVAQLCVLNSKLHCWQTTQNLSLVSNYQQ